jgi:hypothetical protein
MSGHLYEKVMRHGPTGCYGISFYLAWQVISNADEPRFENFKAQKIFPGGISFTFSSSLYTLIPMVKFIKAGKVRINPTSQRKRKRIISSDPFETDG